MMAGRFRFFWGMKTYDEVQHCFLTVGLVYPDDVFTFLLNLIIVMASNCYLVGPSGELFVEYLVRHCALSDLYRNDSENSKVKFGKFCPLELRAICEKGLLITFTVSEMGRCISELCRQGSSYLSGMLSD